MIVWRICKSRHLRAALTGRGAEKFGGRWNFPGEAVVYTSSSLSLAALELFVQMDSDLSAKDLHWLAIHVPDDASQEVIKVTGLPRQWRRYPAPESLRNIGARWLREGRSLLLIVPSAVNPEENNILLNPLHPEMPGVAIARTKPFRFDSRMWK